MKTLKHAIDKSQHAMEKSRPTMLITNHEKAINPYKSPYVRILKEKILQIQAMKRFISINDIVQQIFNNSKELFNSL